MDCGLALRVESLKQLKSQYSDRWIKVPVKSNSPVLRDRVKEWTIVRSFSNSQVFEALRLIVSFKVASALIQGFWTVMSATAILSRLRRARAPRNDHRQTPFATQSLGQ